MFWDVSAIKGYSIRGSNGSLGSVSDLLFDDQHDEYADPDDD